MKYKLIGSGDINNLIETILINRGIADPDTYLSLDESCCNPYTNLNNIDEAVKCLDKHLNQEDLISILVDCDPDGYTSAATMYQYIKKLNADYPLEYIIHHDNKAHGLDKIGDGEIVIPEGTKLLIVPDAGTNDGKQCNELIDSGIDVIILDHHQFNDVEESELDKKMNNEVNRAIIVNNQMSEKYTDKSFSGVGVVYEFCRALDDFYMCDYANDFLDYVALGNIADSMSIKDYQTRYYINQGLNNITHKIILDLGAVQSYSMNDVYNIHNVTWFITPIINAMVRLGTFEERSDLFEAFIETDKTFPYVKRGSKIEIQETITAHMARLCKNIKSRQDKIRDKVYAELLELVNINNKVPIVVIKNADSGIVGLSCIKLASAINKPCIVLRDMGDGRLSGSARNCDKSPIEDFLQFNKDSGVFDLCAGHPSAHGITLQASRLEEAQKVLNDMLDGVEYDDTILCDFIISVDDLTPEFIGTIHASQWLYGKGLEEPKVAIEGVKIRLDECKLMGKEQDSVSFYCNGVKYCKFKCSLDDEILNFVTNQNQSLATLNIIGECSINEYNGIVEPQVIIKDYEFVK